MSLQDIFMTVSSGVVIVLFLIVIALFFYEQIIDRLERRDERMLDEVLAQMVLQEERES